MITSDKFRNNKTNDLKQGHFFKIRINDLDVGGFWMFEASMIIREIMVDACYLTSICLLPQFLKNECIEEVKQDILIKMIESNHSIALIDSCDGQYFPQNGFAYDMENYQFEINTELVRLMALSDNMQCKCGSFKRNPEIFETFHKIKAKCSKSRSAKQLIIKDFMAVYKELGVQLAYLDNDEVFGYFLFNVDFEKKIMKIYEFEWNNGSAFQILARFIMNYKQYVRTIMFEAVNREFPIDYFVEDFWNYNTDVIFKFSPLHKFRILDFQQIINKVVNWAELEEKIILRIEDENIKQNDLCFELYMTGCIAKGKTENYDICIAIEDMAELLRGSITIMELELLDKLKIKNRDKLHILDRLFSKIILKPLGYTKYI